MTAQMGEREGLLGCPFCGSTRSLASGGDDKFVGVRCLNCEAVGPNHYGKFEWDNRAHAQGPLTTAPAKWEDPLVQTVYRLLCNDIEPPEGEHWEGFVARRIVAALRAPEAADAGAVPVPVDAMVNLVNYQEQCDMDGVMVKVSRQALMEVLIYVTEVRPDNKWASAPTSTNGNTGGQQS